uniref:Uncharacterized protein n=1 Tax=Ixodes ricinus TaxID=34613 RepID=A0A147BUP4_IXORI
MLMAVSCLSPVRTQILMSALSRSATVSGTPSCSLSSMAVDPRSDRFVSMSCAASSILRSLNWIDVTALWYEAFHSS